MFFGIVLIVVGIVALLEKFGMLTGPTWGYIWPSLIIAWGISLIIRRGHGGSWCCWGPEREKGEDRPGMP